MAQREPSAYAAPRDVLANVAWVETLREHRPSRHTRSVWKTTEVKRPRPWDCRPVRTPGAGPQRAGSAVPGSFRVLDHLGHLGYFDVVGILDDSDHADELDHLDLVDIPGDKARDGGDRRRIVGTLT